MTYYNNAEELDKPLFPLYRNLVAEKDASV